MLPEGCGLDGVLMNYYGSDRDDYKAIVIDVDRRRNGENGILAFRYVITDIMSPNLTAIERLNILHEMELRHHQCFGRRYQNFSIVDHHTVVCKQDVLNILHNGYHTYCTLMSPKSCYKPGTNYNVLRLKNLRLDFVEETEEQVIEAAKNDPIPEPLKKDKALRLELESLLNNPVEPVVFASGEEKISRLNEPYVKYMKRIRVIKDQLNRYPERPVWKPTPRKYDITNKTKEEIEVLKADLAHEQKEIKVALAQSRAKRMGCNYVKDVECTWVLTPTDDPKKPEYTAWDTVLGFAEYTRSSPDEPEVLETSVWNTVSNAYKEFQKDICNKIFEFNSRINSICEVIRSEHYSNDDSINMMDNMVEERDDIIKVLASNVRRFTLYVREYKGTRNKKKQCESLESWTGSECHKLRTGLSDLVSDNELNIFKVSKIPSLASEEEMKKSKAKIPPIMSEEDMKKLKDLIRQQPAVKSDYIDKFSEIPKPQHFLKWIHELNMLIST